MEFGQLYPFYPFSKIPSFLGLHCATTLAQATSTVASSILSTNPSDSFFYTEHFKTVNQTYIPSQVKLLQ
jgi:hypothetical protein